MRSLAVGCALLGSVACSSAPPFVPPTSSGSSTGAPTTTAGANGTTGGTTGGTTAGTTAGTTGSSTGRMTSSGGGTTGTSSGGNGTTSGSYIGLPCTYNTTTYVDSCVPYGYECSLEYDTTDPGTCVLPQETVQCLPNVGCQDGGKPELACTDGFNNNNKDVHLCVYPCKTANDCAEIFENCLPSLKVCFFDLCGENAAGKFTGPFWGRCTVDDGGNTGQCLSFNMGAYALCEQNGFDFTDEACNPHGRVGTDSECDFGDICVGDYDATTGTPVSDGGVCLPISVDGGCVEGYDSLPNPGADWEICVQDCAETGTCTVGTCFTDTTTGMHICLPTLP